jgi:hypothetical protein
MEVDREPIPDIEISASVKARELRVRTAPQMHTERLEFPDGRGDQGSSRARLPDRVLDGRTYRNIGVRAWLRTRLVNRT